MFYSKSTNGFYDPEIHSTIPTDAVEITEAEWRSLLDGQSTGKIITTDVNGVPTLVLPPEPTIDEVIKDYTKQIQKHLDETAQSKGYDSIISACSYAAVANPYQAEAIQFLNWRSNCWVTGLQILTDVQNGARVVPTASELIALLPVFQ